VCSSDLHVIGIDHPWIETADLIWQNQAGGRWGQALLYFTPELDFKAQREDVERCLTPALGAPTKQEGDHLAGDVTLDYTRGGGVPRVYVAKQLVMILIDAGEGDTAAGLAKVIATVAGC